jgi:hypothetical protein
MALLTHIGSDSDHLKIGTVKFTPSTPKVGQNVTILATGTLGTFYITAKKKNVYISFR